ncbi:MAG TPA: hypothetical protein VEO54_23275 [Thermoanaerobaculia bacterium]|nr:hypothetical protein [Thermoanaerobaculia bacterium]
MRTASRSRDIGGASALASSGELTILLWATTQGLVLSRFSPDGTLLHVVEPRLARLGERVWMTYGSTPSGHHLHLSPADEPSVWQVVAASERTIDHALASRGASLWIAYMRDSRLYVRTADAGPARRRPSAK